MRSFACTFCSGTITVADPAVKSVTCTHCKAFLPVPAAASDAAPATSPRVAPRFPFALLALAAPTAIILLAVVPLLALTQQWSGLVFALLTGVGLSAITLRRMRGRWTALRFLWVLALAGFWFAAGASVSLEHYAIIQNFAPLQAEFSGFVPPPALASTPPQPIKLKLFPLFLRSRDNKPMRNGAPALPFHSIDMDLYRRLPPLLKAKTAAEVRTVVLLDWGWDATTHFGTCAVTLIDRKSRTVVAAKLLTTPDTSMLIHSPGWRGPQPTNKDVINYLRTLKIEAERE